MSDLPKLTWKDQLEKFGHALIPGVFRQQAVNAMRAGATLAAVRLGETSLQIAKNEKGSEYPALLFWPKNHSVALDDATRFLASYVQEVLGDDVLQLNNQWYFRMPGDGDQFGWHQDISFRTPREDFDRIEDRYLQTAIIVDEMSFENGAIEFLTGTHKDGERADLVPRDNSERGLRKFDRRGLAGTKVHAKPGDVLVWSVMVVHGSEPNYSNRSRAYYMNGFAAASALRKEGRFPWYLRNGRLV